MQAKRVKPVFEEKTVKTQLANQVTMVKVAKPDNVAFLVMSENKDNQDPM
jgi:hypothetical protein